MYKKLCVIPLGTVLLCACSLKNPFSSEIPSTPIPANPNPIVTTSPFVSPKTTPDSNPVVGLKINNGEIVIKLFTAETPNTVKNFLNKVNSGYYTNLTFHRVEPNFVIQGGDPTGTGNGGGKIASEITNRPFVRGSVGLARGTEKQWSNDSQFFICLNTEECKHLTGEYVNFGEVLSGMEYADQVSQGDKITSLGSRTK